MFNVIKAIEAAADLPIIEARDYLLLPPHIEKGEKETPTLRLPLS